MKLPQSKFDPKRWAIVGAAIALIVGLVGVFPASPHRRLHQRLHQRLTRHNFAT